MIPWVNSSVCLLWWLFLSISKLYHQWEIGSLHNVSGSWFLLYIWILLMFLDISYHVISTKKFYKVKKKTFGIELSFAIFLHLFLISVWMMYVHVCILACMCKCKHVEVTRQFVNADFLPLQCSYWHQTQVVVFGNGYSYLWAISWAFIFIYLFS